MVAVTLGAHEVQYCALLAERRNVVKEVYGVRNQRFHRRTDYETHLIGVMGEYAVGQYFGIKVDASVSLSGDDKVTDMRIGDWAVQIKTRLPQKPPLYLYFNEVSLFRADRAVCACITGPATVQLVGWIDRGRFSVQARELNFGYGRRVGVPHQTLSDMKEW